MKEVKYFHKILCLFIGIKYNNKSSIKYKIVLKIYNG